jgi:acid phosphatase family membrane protein YuiD
MQTRNRIADPDGLRRRLRRVVRAATLAGLLFASCACCAGGGPLGIDHLLPYDDSGIWNRRYQQAVEYGLIVTEVAGALWEGGESRFGRTLWQSIDASVAGGISAQLLKVSFSRVRPIDSNGNPDLWFQGHGNESFPSGEVTLASAVVTPLVLEYGHDRPLVYALELLPLYDAVARMKVQAHWQTDVLAGFALGSAAGWLMHRNPDTPYILRLMPHGIYVGLKTH